MDRELIIIGDRVLIRLDNEKEMTNSGLYLPQGAYEKEKVHSGKVIKTGPGIPVADPQELHKESWKQPTETEAKYVPLQAKVHDRAIFLRNSAIDMEFENTKYVIVPHSAILALIRYDNPEDLI
ncbi:MAG: co-chaperone GroES family protein [Candidatus Omnitrophica bacterium]|nr:co-chaperone GroES family protein [Candidatus Omnitrophota bacterium]MBU1925985.1 co-chaperone GroES family protein [Candidatus Omnitrophota bacterium]